MVTKFWLWKSQNLEKKWLFTVIEAEISDVITKDKK